MRGRMHIWRVLLATSAMLIAGVFTSLSAQRGSQDTAGDIGLMTGKAAPEWKLQGWINAPSNAPSLDMKQLRGSVVLLRFLNDSAPSAQTLNDLGVKYGPRGMKVVGIYAPTPFPTATEMAAVKEFTLAHGFQFPVGVDAQWETLNRYWLSPADAELTAATFLIDRKGVIRYIQSDGQYEKNSQNGAERKAYAKLEKAIESLLTPENNGSGDEKTASR